MKGICKKLVAVTLGITLAIAVFPSGTVRAEDKPKKTAEEEYAFYNQDISAGPWNVSEGVTAYVQQMLWEPDPGQVRNSRISGLAMELQKSEVTHLRVLAV